MSDSDDSDLRTFRGFTTTRPAGFCFFWVDISTNKNMKGLLAGRVPTDPPPDPGVTPPLRCHWWKLFKVLCSGEAQRDGLDVVARETDVVWLSVLMVLAGV